MYENESYLIKQLQKGDEKAFEKIFKTYYISLVNYAIGLVSDIETAKDLTEDIFYFIWDNRKIIHISQSLRGYLYKITHNKCLDYLKRQQVKQKHIKEVIISKKQEEQENILFASFYQPDYFSEELELKLKTAIDSLPKQAKIIFIMKRLKGMSYKEISKELNISENTIRKQMSRSLQKIMTALKIG